MDGWMDGRRVSTEVLDGWIGLAGSFYLLGSFVGFVALLTSLRVMGLVRWSVDVRAVVRFLSFFFLSFFLSFRLSTDQLLLNQERASASNPAVHSPASMEQWPSQGAIQIRNLRLR